MSEIESYLNSLREVSFGRRHLTETYLILDSEIRQLNGVLAMMKDKDSFPDSEDYQVQMLESVSRNLALLRDFAKELGSE